MKRRVMHSLQPPVDESSLTFLVACYSFTDCDALRDHA
jgi:hypothetical protein